MYYGNSGQSTDSATTTGVWDDDYVGVWHLPDDASASTSDSTQYDNDGTAIDNASSTSAGQIDGAFLFDGGSDCIDAGNKESLNFGTSTNFSVTFWFKRKNFVNYARVIFKGSDSSNGLDKGWQVRNLNDNVNLYVSNGTTSRRWATHPGTITDDIWYHFAGVVDRDGNMAAYLNGAVGTPTNVSDYINGVDISNAHNFKIGGGGAESNEHFNGLIDEVRISSTTRTAGWIKTVS